MAQIKTNIREQDMAGMVCVLLRKLLRRGEGNVVVLTDEELDHQPDCRIRCMINPETDLLELTYTEGDNHE